MSSILHTDEIAWLRQHAWSWHGANQASVVAAQPASYGGRGSEPELIRRYRPGDDIRWVDWPATMRMQHAMVRQPQPMQQGTVRIILDTSASMTNFPDKWRAALRAVAAVGVMVIAQLNRIELVLPTQRVMSAHQPVWLTQCDALLHQVPDAPFDFPDVLPFSPQPAIFCSDMWSEQWQTQVRQFADSTTQGLCLQVLDISEVAPALMGEITLVDSESRIQRTLTIDEAILQRYHTAYQQHIQHIQQTCAQCGLRYMQLNSTDDVLRAMVEVSS